VSIDQRHAGNVSVALETTGVVAGRHADAAVTRKNSGAERRMVLFITGARLGEGSRIDGGTLDLGARPSRT
jgi:hypothetical protein